MAEELEEFTLRAQVRELAKRYFPRMLRIPTLKIQRLGDDEYDDSPAHLNALTSTIYIDERVSTFQEKTTRILILHELIHWSLFQDNGDPDNEEGERFEIELARIKKLGAYTGLL